MTRLIRLLRPGTNPLARGVDRLEAAVVILAMVVGLVLVPVMLTVGSLTHAGLAGERGQQLRDRYATVAVLTEDAPAVNVGIRGAVAGKSDVPARWRLSDGATRTGVVRVADGRKAGNEIPIWLDRSGRPVDPPVSALDVWAAGATAAVCGWLVVVGLLALACFGFHVALNRRRFRAWQTEWTTVEPKWHDRML